MIFEKYSLPSVKLLPHLFFHIGIQGKPNVEMWHVNSPLCQTEWEKIVSWPKAAAFWIFCTTGTSQRYEPAIILSDCKTD